MVPIPMLMLWVAAASFVSYYAGYRSAEKQYGKGTRKPKNSSVHGGYCNCVVCVRGGDHVDDAKLPTVAKTFLARGAAVTYEEVDEERGLADIDGSRDVFHGGR